MTKAKAWAAPIILALFGCIVLMALGVWQVQRLGWKEALIDRLDATIAGAPVPFPPIEFTNYTPVSFSGHPVGEAFHILTVSETVGQGYRIVQPFENDEIRVLVDAGFVPEASKDEALFEDKLYDIIGNLYIPEATLKTAPDLERNVWIDYNIETMSDISGSLPYIIVARDAMTPAITPLPLTSNLPNNHAQYAVTWFSLAAIWLIMSVYWGLTRQRGEKES